MQFQAQERCPDCKRGNIIKNKCHLCHSEGIVKQKKDIPIPIPKGMPENFILSIPGEADAFPGHNTGDIILEITSVLSPQIPLRRDNNDLHHDLSITLLEALVGFRKEIPHFSGPVIVESNQITVPGQVITLPKKGLPIHNKEGSFGNLYVHITVIYPNKIQESDKTALRKLLPE
uniref:Chaperone DnaJ C-terminal domain-containing protein n=1 Tax=Arcella intermedia TaxID=1963864 RepID=A0A6B2LM80_9EUKA